MSNDNDIVDAMKAECERQSENCLYTSVSLLIWLRRARRLRQVFVVAPIIFGSIATWSILNDPQVAWFRWATATCALLAGVFPAIYAALGLDMRVREIADMAAEFTNLRDRFRHAANISSLQSLEKFESEFNGLMDRMDSARSTSITPPEWCFERARGKIKSRHYSHDRDETPAN